MKKIGAKIFVNLITITRVVGTFLMPFLSSKFNAEEMTIYIIVLLLTDSIDGMMARKLNASTLFGALLDALADKLLALATLMVLAFNYHLIYIPIILEAIITVINVVSGTKGSTMESTELGKAKTWVLGICTVVGYITIYSNDFAHLFNENDDVGLGLVNIFNFINNYSNIFMLLITIIASLIDLVVAIKYYIRNKKDIRNNINHGIDAKKYKLKAGEKLKVALFDTEFYLKTKNIPIIMRLGEVEE